MTDFRIAARMLLRSPGFTLIAVLTLALGIGATTAIFSVIQAVLLTPLPYPNAERLVMISQQKGDLDLLVAGDDFQEWQKARSFESMSAWHEWRGARTFMLPGKNGAEQLTGAAVPASFFPTLATQPILGRAFGPDEDAPDGNIAVMISHALWQRRFGGDSNIIGQTIPIDNFWRKQYTILGVLPPGFNFPDKSDVWVSRASTQRNISGRGHHHKVIARLKPGVSLAQAQAELNTIQSRILAQFPDERTADRAKITQLVDHEVGTQMRPALMILFVAVGFLLLIACANIANLLLARSAARQKEMAIRIALGAARKHILTQLLAENALLSLLGAIVGVIFAHWGLQLLISLGNEIPRLSAVHLNLSTLAIALSASALAAFLFGLAPAAQLLHPNLNDALQESGRTGSDSPRQGRFRAALIIGEIALTLVLLVGAGLMIKSFARLQNVPLGFDADHLVAAEFDLSATNYYSNGRDRLFFAQLMQRVASNPQIESVSGAWYLPIIGRTHASEEMTLEAHQTRADQKIIAAWNAITPRYFETLKTPIIQGRVFTDLDASNANHLIVINETLARKYFGNENPIGRRIAMGTAPFSRERERRPHWREVIGVVRDLRPRLDVEPFPEVFYPYQDWPWHVCFLVARSSAPPAQIAAIIRNEVKALNPDQPVSSIRAMSQIMGQSTAQHRFRALLLTLFSATALFLSAVGLYGVISYIVSQRTHEFGIRLALGARGPDLLKLVLKRGLLLITLGALIGLALAANLSALIQKLLFQIEALDPLILIAAPVLLALISLIACYIPARRASRVDPMDALRCQ